MSKNPLISIIIPYHKKKKYFCKTIQSIVSQSFKNFEIILIYDDTNLNELNLVRKVLLKVQRKKIIINKNILGPGISRNIGILKSNGKYLAFCDADDIWSKNKLSSQINFMKKKKINFCHSSYNIINSKNKKIGYFNIKKKVSYKDLLKSCDIGLSTVMIDKKIVNKKKNFCALKTKEDYFLWLQIIKKLKFIYGQNEYLVSWRYNRGSLSDSFSQKLIDSFRLYHIYEKYNIFVSFFYVIRLSFYALKKKIKIYNLI